MSFLPSRIRQARGDMSLREFAKLLNVSHEVVRKWENGDSEPTASQLARMATVTARPLEFFFRAARRPA